MQISICLFLLLLLQLQLLALLLQEIQLISKNLLSVWKMTEQEEQLLGDHNSQQKE